MARIVRFHPSNVWPYPLQVPGGSFYHGNIADVSGYLGDEKGVDVHDLIAQLVLEDENIYAPGNAVRVDICCRPVGHLPRESARQYRQKLKELGIPDVIGECYASVTGGHIMKSGFQADFMVRLDLLVSTMSPLKPAANSSLLPKPSRSSQNRDPVDRWTKQGNGC